MYEVSGGGEHLRGPGRALVLPVASHVERKPDPVATQGGFEEEPGMAQDVGGERVEAAFDFDFAAWPAADADRLGVGLHRERPGVEAGG